MVRGHRAVNGKPIENAADLVAASDATPVGETFRFTIDRAGSSMTIEMKRPADFMGLQAMIRKR